MLRKGQQYVLGKKLQFKMKGKRRRGGSKNMWKKLEVRRSKKVVFKNKMP